MAWSDFEQMVLLKKKLAIPAQLEPIVNDLGGTCQLFEPKGKNHQTDGWLVLFETCKLSLSFINQLFAAKDYWMYSLMLLWNHPTDDKLVTKQLYQALYPSESPSTTQEFEQLLIVFLGDLYDSFDTAGRTIREHKYTDPGMQTLAQILTDEGKNNGGKSYMS